MWDLIVSVPDHCLSFYCSPFQLALFATGTVDPRSEQLLCVYMNHCGT